VASEKTLIRALDLLTTASHGEISALGLVASRQTKNIKQIVGSKNVVAVGISEKESGGKPT
jgi:hypothetical protein